MDFGFNLNRTANASAWRLLPNRWDFVAFPLIICVIAMAAIGFHETMAPISTLKTQVISLDPTNLPEYALRTTLRMLAALVASFAFTLAYGTLAAKSRRAGMVLIPILDILQSVPVLGYISFTVTFFLALFPRRVLGAEFAAIFAIFTSQAWNMTFSFYQSLRTVPRDLDEVSRGFHLTAWQRFWKLEVPFSMPGLIWNMMMSMSGGWFFVVASEAITVGNNTITLPGIGAYLAQAIAERDLAAVGWVILTMTVVILAYDQLMFRPLVAWADKFRMETTSSGSAPESWLLDLVRRTRLIHQLLVPAGWLFAKLARVPLRVALPRVAGGKARGAKKRASRAGDIAWACVLLVATVYVVWRVGAYVRTGVTMDEVWRVIALGFVTLVRVVVLVAVSSLIWVPVGVLIGLRPAVAEKIQPLAQFLAAFPANLLFPVFVVAIVRFHLNPDIWLSPLIVLGTQWYILFNVIAGASAYPNDYREAATNFRIRGWQWWRQVMLPGVFPYYVTGAITASGGAWNASIVAEAVQWGDTRLVAHGLGAYIAETTAAGDFPKIILGVAIMSLFVTLFNRMLWRPLYAYAEAKLRLD
ncbi:ABC transporter permease subunit [Trinickia caryophylli]|uniref:NitT/TauT family transport system permease protein n=1 Tax=Trinickia caryophylli TaxID=28094 RepID=A0A1X7GYT1_TRICW|nr:ABC transporter permease subunit [Trinickia caryophylli]PMS10103.1 sulfonate ABC transporter permease [Trinickia caryophylli]TRX18202.1 ABC transporter permease subunit [Trinickia caryophylli]WQE11009.1 ABC transporter permease subunit [Trinickia caryophylli]SMF76887.1 NitT/TauT family transport system permease protein [Trinickia caryophylli]GLU35374.1 ABC transporter permease [Trinickia caryophylli]